VRTVLCLLTAAALLGCSASRRAEAFGGLPRQLSAQQHRGQRVFMRMCNQCHPDGDAGLAPALKDKAAPASAIKLQVRQGPGRMPSFDDKTIADSELDDLVSYLRVLRKGG